MAKLLIVDDDDAVRLSLSRVLSDGGHDITEAANAEAGLAALREDTFSLVIADVWMPGVDGISLLKQIRNAWPGMKVLIISGGGADASLEEVSARADIYGAVDILYKPIENDELVAAVNAALGSAG